MIEYVNFCSLIIIPTNDLLIQFSTLNRLVLSSRGILNPQNYWTNETKRTLASIMISPLPPYLHLSPVVSMVITLGPACQWSFLTPEGNLWPEGSRPGSRGQKWPEGNESTSVIGSLTSPHILILRLKHRPRPSILQINQLENCSFIHEPLAVSSIWRSRHLITHYVWCLNAAGHSCENINVASIIFPQHECVGVCLYETSC